jgi:serine/threonine protein kinase/tetratricopeptide (TPR) repeat protein
MSNPQAASSLEYRVGDQPVPGYTIVRELGRGAMGVVWLAETESGFERALKVISLQQRGGKKEYRGLRTIKQRKLLHGNLLTLIDYWLKDRDGKLIPDTDDLDGTDSFFLPPSGQSPQPHTLAATTPQSLSTTSADGNSPKRGGSSPAAGNPPVQRTATRMAGTLVNAFVEAPESGLGQTLDVAQKPRETGRRPVQLIVAMELGHKTLDDRQKQCQEDRLPGIPADELLPYMEQAARGLDYLHREGIVHRDVKPQNIMLVGDVAKVCDYGLVITTDADLRATSNAFTPLYASPEAIAEHPLTGQSDQYSLAVTYIELRTGRTPYKSETVASVYAAKESGKYDLSRIRSSAVRTVLKRALSKSPGERFGSCSAFIRELENAEHAKVGALRALVAMGAIALVAAGVALAFPEVRERFFPSEAGKNGDTRIVVTPARPSDRSVPKTPNNELPAVPLPQPPPEMRKVVNDARALRLAGKFDEAAQKLDELKIDPGSTDLSQWPHHLERLHLDMSRQLDAPSSIASSQWEAWRLRAEQLSPAVRGQSAEQSELAALKIFIATQLDPTQLSLAQPLADDFARAMTGKDQWSQVFSEREQARLVSLQETLSQRVLAGSEPLPTAWKKRFTEIWPKPAAAQLLVNRVRVRIREANPQGLAAAATDLDEVAARSDLEALPTVKSQLADVRIEIKHAENRLLVQSLSKHLTSDDFLVNADVRKQLIDQIRALGDIDELPLASLLRIEAELVEQGDKRYAMDALDDLRQLIARLDTSTDPTFRDWIDYAQFLLVRVEISMQRGGTPTALSAPVDVLLSWPETATADWHTPHRKDQAIEALLRLADAAVPISEKDAVRFSELPRDLTLQVATAVSFLDKAKRLGCDAPDLHGLLALALSIPARQLEQPDAWARVAQSADQALTLWPSVTDSARQARLPAVQYVGALAAARLNDPAAQARNRQAITTFAALLKQSFRDDRLKNASVDRGILENIVLPGLQVPLTDGQTPARDLAALWGAKGRLLERNPDSVFLAIRGVKPVDHPDDYARAMLTAHDAYAKAIKLQGDVSYTAGSARTVLKLPREVFDWQKYEGELADLVQLGGQAALTDPSLLFADACVLRRRAFKAPQRAEKAKLAEQALDRFKKLDAATRDSDPYSIRGVALCAASDTFLKAAFWTPVQSSDEAKGDGSQRTKYFFLRQALDCASAAQTDPDLLLPEEARTAKGNALEDLAYCYKETSDYQRAATAFQEAIEQIGRRRSKAYALMSLGRCQYRWAMDAARIDGNQEERVKRLREAFQSLRDALASARATDPSVAPEASFWLSTVVLESALDGPGNLELPEAQAPKGFRSSSLSRLKSGLDDPNRKPEAVKELAERFRLMERARRDTIAAAQEARTHSAIEWSQFMPTAAVLGKRLVDELGAVKNDVPIDLAPPAILEEVRKQVQELLALAEQHVAVLSPRERRSLVDLLARVQPDASPQKAAPLYQTYEKLFADDNDDSRAQLVLLRLMRSSAMNAVDCPEAEQAAGRITNPQLANWARGYCGKFKADVALRPYRDRLKAYLRDPETSKALTLTDDPKLRTIQDAFATALRSLGMSTDPRTMENLNRLLAAPLDEIESGKWQADLTNLEADSLRLNIEETEKLIRIQLYELLDARIYLHKADWSLKDLKKPLPEEGRAAVGQMVDCLKPLRFVEVRFSDTKMDDYLRDYLRACEARLAR